MSRRAGLLMVLGALGAAPGLTAQELDNAIFHFSQLDLHASRSSGPTVGTWEASGWFGTDFDRIWWSTDGERLDGAFGDAELMVLYGHYARRFWDVVVGYRQEVEPVSQAYLAFGVMGLAPYWFRVEALGLVSDDGRPRPPARGRDRSLPHPAPGPPAYAPARCASDRRRRSGEAKGVAHDRAGRKEPIRGPTEVRPLRRSKVGRKEGHR